MIELDLAKHETVARAVLEELVGDDKFFRPMLIGFRDGAELVMVLPPPPGDGDTIVSVGGLISGALGLDELLLLADTYTTHTLLNPVTGKQWQVGDMADVVENHDGIAKGWVSDALVLQLLRRGESRPEIRMMPYRREPDYRITWAPTRMMPSDSDEIVGGRLTMLMNRPVYVPETTRQDADLAVLNVLRAVGCDVTWVGDF